MSNTAAEVIHSDVFIVTGSNTAESHPIIGLQMKEAVEKHGAKLIVVDPRRVELANWSTLWLPQLPGTDVPVFAAMAHVIIEEKLYNQDFIDRRTENFDDFSKSMEKFTPEFAESVSGVDRNLIIEAARMYATAERGAIYWALGISESTHGVDNALALVHLALLTGHIGREGTGLNPLRGQNNVQGASDSGAMPWHYPGYMEVDDPASAEIWEKVWNIEPGGLSQEKGLTTTEILTNVGEDGVRALYIMGENPMMSEPNLNVTRHHMENLEILPAASWAEKDGTFTNTDRRVQRIRKALAPRGQSRADIEIISQLAKRIEDRLGRSASAFWDYENAEEVLIEMGSVVPAYRGVRYERIDEVGLQTPVPDEDHPGTPFLFEESFPSGRAKFHLLEYVPSAEPPDHDYPLILTTGRLLEHWHGGTMTRHSLLDELYPEALVEINRVDAARTGVKTGDVVRVTSRRGSVVLRANVTEKANLGVVFIPWHFHEAAANLLTLDELDPLAKIPEYKACAVRVDLASEDELENPEARTLRGRW
jgi:predicted molibdopterin-dependent oxidoreductase YjgC